MFKILLFLAFISSNAAQAQFSRFDFQGTTYIFKSDDQLPFLGPELQPQRQGNLSDLLPSPGNTEFLEALLKQSRLTALKIDDAVTRLVSARKFFPEDRFGWIGEIDSREGKIVLPPGEAQGQSTFRFGSLEQYHSFSIKNGVDGGFISMSAASFVSKNQESSQVYILDRINGKTFPQTISAAGEVTAVNLAWIDNSLILMLAVNVKGSNSSQLVFLQGRESGWEVKKTFFFDKIIELIDVSFPDGLRNVLTLHSKEDRGKIETLELFPDLSLENSAPGSIMRWSVPARPDSVINLTFD